MKFSEYISIILLYIFFKFTDLIIKKSLDLSNKTFYRYQAPASGHFD